jgi:hypothetical protein
VYFSPVLLPVYPRPASPAGQGGLFAAAVLSASLDSNKKNVDAWLAIVGPESGSYVTPGQSLMGEIKHD